MPNVKYSVAMGIQFTFEADFRTDDYERLVDLANLQAITSQAS